jgi:hypothetical protein
MITLKVIQTSKPIFDELPNTQAHRVCKWDSEGSGTELKDELQKYTFHYCIIN